MTETRACATALNTLLLLMRTSQDESMRISAAQSVLSFCAIALNQEQLEALAEDVVGRLSEPRLEACRG